MHNETFKKCGNIIIIYSKLTEVQNNHHHHNNPLNSLHAPVSGLEKGVHCSDEDRKHARRRNQHVHVPCHPHKAEEFSGSEPQRTPLRRGSRHGIRQELAPCRWAGVDLSRRFVPDDNDILLEKIYELTIVARSF